MIAHRSRAENKFFIMHINKFIHNITLLQLLGIYIYKFIVCKKFLHIQSCKIFSMYIYQFKHILQLNKFINIFKFIHGIFITSIYSRFCKPNRSQVQFRSFKQTRTSLYRARVSSTSWTARWIICSPDHRYVPTNINSWIRTYVSNTNIEKARVL